MLQMIPGYSQISKALAGRLLLRSLSQGAYTGGVSVAQDIAAGQLADKTVPESIDLKKAGVATALGFGLEFVGSPILNTLFNNLAKNSRFFTVDAITGAPTITISSKGENVTLTIGDKKNDTANTYKKIIGKSEHSFDCHMAVENFKIGPDAYNVTISKKKAFQFKHATKPLGYFIAMEPDSVV